MLGGGEGPAALEEDVDKLKKRERAIKNLNPQSYMNDENAIIILISGYKVLIDKDDLNRVVDVGLWHKIKNPNAVYFCHTVNYPKVHQIKLHQFIINPPNNMQVDHVSGDTLDNRKVNLRICSHAENQQNRKKGKNNTSGYKGVYFHCGKRKWRTTICVNKKRIYLGYFDTPEEAHEAYCEASKKYHGEFGRIA